MAGMYDSVSLGGIIKAADDNPIFNTLNSGTQYADSMLNKYVTKPATDWIANKAFDARSSALGDTNAPTDSSQASQNQSGAIPAPDSNQPTSDGSTPPVAPPGVPQGAIPTPDSPGQWSTSSLFNTGSPDGGQPGDTDPNSQAGGAQAAAEQQKGIDASAQKAADDASKGGSTPPPVSTGTASESLAGRNQNIQAGVGNPITGQVSTNLPKPLTADQQKNNTLDQTGQQSFNQMNTVGHWYQSQSFLMGMMQFGLSLLDGKGYSASFQAGASYFDQHYGMEQRQAWGDDLMKKGYTRESIMQYIQSGNAKDLMNVQDIDTARQLKQQQIQMGQANIQGQQLQNNEMAYNQSPEQRAAAMHDRDVKNQYMLNQNKANAFENTPEYQRLKLQGMQADVNYKNAEATKVGMAGQTGGVNVFVNPTTGLRTNISGAPLVQGKPIYPVTDSKGNYEAQKGFYAAINTETGEPVSVPANMQSYHRIATSADNTIQAVNNFKIEGVKLAGPTGEVSRDFIDNFGARNKADQISILKQIEGYQHNLALAQASLEVGGGRPTNADVAATAASFPTYIDPQTGEPVAVSKERMASMFENTLRQAAQIHEDANAVMHGVYGTKAYTDKSPQDQVARGQRMLFPDGKWRIATKTGNKNDRIWALDPNQQGQ